MKIVAASPVRGQQMRLTFEDGTQALIDRRTFEESPFAVGSVLTDGQWEQLQAASGQNRLRERALYLLSGRSYGKKELADKLRHPRSGPAPTAEQAGQTVDRMEQLGLLNDAEYALRRARDMQAYQLYPRRRIAAELSARGIDRETVQQALEQLEGTDRETARALLQKNYARKLTEEDGVRRVTDALVRRGFSFEDVRAALRTCESLQQEPEETWP